MNKRKYSLRYEERVMEPLGTRKCRLSNFKLHLSLKFKLDSYDSKYEKSLDDKKYHKTRGIILFSDSNPEFPKLNSKFYSLKKWAISDYLEYYHYFTTQCRAIEAYRGERLVRLTKGTISNDELKYLEKISSGLFKIEKIVGEYFLKHNVTYEELVKDLEMDIPVVVLESILAKQGSAKLTLSDYIK